MINSTMNSSLLNASLSSSVMNSTISSTSGSGSAPSSSAASLKHECPKCGEAFAVKRMLEFHLQTHPGRNRRFICDHCDRAFATARVLQRHAKKHEQGEFPYQCGQCGGRSFRTELERTRHIRDCHLSKLIADSSRRAVYPVAGKLSIQALRGEMPSKPATHVCKDCGKRFVEKSRLLLHRRLHAGDRLHECPVCSGAFVHAAHLREHMQKTHLALSSSFKCPEPQCDKVCASKVSLARHLRTHLESEDERDE